MLNHITILYLPLFYFNCILVCTGLVGASRKSPCPVIIIIIIIIIIINVDASKADSCRLISHLIAWESNIKIHMVAPVLRLVISYGAQCTLPQGQEVCSEETDNTRLFVCMCCKELQRMSGINKICNKASYSTYVFSLLTLYSSSGRLLRPLYT